MTAQLQAKHRERTERRRGELWRPLQPLAHHPGRPHRADPRAPSAGAPVPDRGLRALPEDERLDGRGRAHPPAVGGEMYLQGVSTRKVEAVTGKLSGVKISKDAVSRIAARFDDAFAEWRTRQLDRERSYPYLYLDATYLKARWAGAVRDVALLVAVGVSDEGYREVLAVEAAAGERSETWRGLLQGLVERGLRGVKLVISDDHESIKQAARVELPGAAWQRCVVHFERNVLAHVPQAETEAVAADLKVVFQAARRETAEQLAASFAERYGESYPKAVATLTRGLDEALTYTAFPSSHHRRFQFSSSFPPSCSARWYPRRLPRTPTRRPQPTPVPRATAPRHHLHRRPRLRRPHPRRAPGGRHPEGIGRGRVSIDECRVGKPEHALNFPCVLILCSGSDTLGLRRRQAGKAKSFGRCHPEPEARSLAEFTLPQQGSGQAPWDSDLLSRPTNLPLEAVSALAKKGS